MAGEHAEPTPRWLVLFHQIPPKPDYLRVKIGRRLARIGAVALKNTVYALPQNDSTREHFQWVVRDVVAAGGEATLLEARLIDGISDADVEGLFRVARDADYTAVGEAARSLTDRLGKGSLDDELRRQIESELVRLERRLDEICALDFFEAPGRDVAHVLLHTLRLRVTPPRISPTSTGGNSRASYRGRTWVTRTGIHVDRIASAWLIRKFVDADARLKFVPAKGYSAEPGELRFDMYDAEFSHEGDQCTFEVLCSRFELSEPGLSAIAEVVHDIDLKDGKFG